MSLIFINSNIIDIYNINTNSDFLLNSFSIKSPIETQWKFMYSANVRESSSNLDPGGPIMNIFFA